MFDSVAKSVKAEREEQNFDTRAEVKRLTGLTIFVVVVTVLAVLDRCCCSRAGTGAN